MRKRKLLLAVAIVCIFLLGALLVSTDRRLTALTLQVSPTISKITLDGKSVKVGTFGVSPGTHKVVASYPGFTTQSKTFTNQSGATAYVGIALLPDSTATSDWYTTHPDDQKVLEEISGKSFDATSQQITQTAPLIKELPYIGPGLEFRVDYGNGTGANSSKIIIYITAPDQPSQQDALTWIKGQGFNPSKLDIQYITGQP
jgi:hypothetical protein